MVRVVRTPDGPVEIDATGKKAGRGAYVCRLRDCWQQALRRGALGRALKTELSATDQEALSAFGDQQSAPSPDQNRDPSQAQDEGAIQVPTPAPSTLSTRSTLSTPEPPGEHSVQRRPANG
jgi:predicted RNA-binding protein YlxR (DUF448 family)